MRMDLPCCSFKNCKYFLEGNCTSKPIEHERCEFHLLIQFLDDDYDLDRLRKLVEADRDGRCVVLPCKVGDTVYSVLPLCGVNSHRIQKFERNSEGDFASSALMFPFSEFGKTVFRTPEEAQAALERMESNG